MARAGRPGADVLNAACPSRQVLDRSADKWTALIVHVLAEGTHRFGQLQGHNGGISQKMLTQTRRDLDGLVERIVHPVVPPHVDYRLTPRGRSLGEPLPAIRVWASGEPGRDAGRAGPPRPSGGGPGASGLARPGESLSG